LGVGLKIDGWGGRILVTRCHGGGLGAEVARWVRAPRARGTAGSRGAREVQRGLWGCSGTRLSEGLRTRCGSAVKWVCAVTAN
jgi:hypothetical protein